MGLLRWIAKSGFRITMILAVLVFGWHVGSELRLLRGAPPSFLQRLELTALDVKFRHRGPLAPDAWHVAVAGADERAIRTIGRLPWSRAVHAQVADLLSELGAKAIAFDMTFEDPSDRPELQLVGEIGALADRTGLFTAPETIERCAEKAKACPELPSVSRAIESFGDGLERMKSMDDPDERFARAIANSKRTVLGILAHSRLEAEAVGAEAIERSVRLIASSTITELVAEGEGGLSYVIPDARGAIERGIYRRFYGVQAPTPVLAKASPAFGTINAFPDVDGVYRRVPLVSALKGRGILLPSLALESVRVAAGGPPIEVVSDPDDLSPEAIHIGDLSFELELGATAALDWYGEFSADQMPIFSIADLIEGKLDRSLVKDRIVFVAATAVGTHDQRVTPFGSSVPGVSVHATLAQNLLDGRHMLRPRYVIAFELFVFLMIGLISGLVMTRLGAGGQIALAAAMVLAWMVIDRYLLFANGLVVYAVLPILQVVLSLVAVASWRFLVEERERRKTRQAFSRYLAPAVMEKVLEHPEEYLKLGGKRCDATVLFSDIRGFTTISEALSPEDLGSLLNRYMTPMTDLVFAHGGTLDKYIGDAVMAFWGAPIPQTDHAVRACRTALAMLKKVDELNLDLEKASLPRIAIGIGLSSGPMTIGNMGSLDHFAYTALGDRVNLGSRLEGQTKEYGVGVIISDACYELVKHKMHCRELGALRVKGKLEPVRIYELISEEPLDAKKRAFVETFHEGLATFRARKWDEAIELFERALDLSGDNGDKCSEDYIMLCEEYREAPPPANWDGVRVATSK
jgi:adenylate cyclase